MTVDYDARSFRVAGERRLLLMGEIHYARSPRAAWAGILDRSVACGLNAVASYIFWNFHEPERDRYDFAGDRDLGYFLDLCAERHLLVLLRMGPYCCAEWNYGGYPAWLREEPGITIRTWSEPYLRRVGKYFGHLCAEIRPYLATNGGPVILAQVENEYANVAKRYGEGGQRYLAWMAGLARELGIGVPILMCEGAAPGVVETVNGHSIGDERVAAFRSRHPTLPLVWTELWPAWYDTWGFQHHERSARNIAWHILRFIGHGGSGINYYMWHGGTNFGRTSMYLQTTSYDFGAPLDEPGRVTEKGAYLGRLHRALAAQAGLLLDGERRRETGADGAVTVTWELAGATLRLRLEPGTRRATLMAGERVVFDSEADWVANRTAFTIKPWQRAAPLTGWQYWREPRPSQRQEEPIRSQNPVEQLSLTADRSDYCWYSARVELAGRGVHRLEIDGGGDFFYVYLDGRLVGRSEPPFRENRGPTVPPSAGATAANSLELQVTDGFRHEFQWRGGSGTRRLEILAVSLGLVKGDWMISGSMETERKGIWGEVRLDGREITGWEMRPGLVGEQAGPAKWRQSDAGGRRRGPVWYEVEFALAPGLLASTADFRLDAAKLGKGMLFVNGRALGRHWSVAGQGYGADEGWQQLEEDGLSLAPAGQPTQRYYHVPQSWLLERNRLTVLEEQGARPEGVALEYRLAGES